MDTQFPLTSGNYEGPTAGAVLAMGAVLVIDVAGMRSEFEAKYGYVRGTE